MMHNQNPNLVAYERALEIIAGMPPAIRMAVCRRFLQRAMKESDVVARRMDLPPEHPERFALSHHIWFGVAQLIFWQSSVPKENAETEVRLVRSDDN